jgi:hypothetical protein
MRYAYGVNNRKEKIIKSMELVVFIKLLLYLAIELSRIDGYGIKISQTKNRSTILKRNFFAEEL